MTSTNLLNSVRGAIMSGMDRGLVQKMVEVQIESIHKSLTSFNIELIKEQNSEMPSEKLIGYLTCEIQALELVLSEAYEAVHFFAENK